MGIVILRSFFVLFAMISGFFLSPDAGGLWGALYGLGAGLAVIVVEMALENVPARRILVGMMGLITGLVSARLLFDFIFLIPAAESTKLFVRVLLYYLLAYLGVMIALRYSGKWSTIITGHLSEENKKPPLILDSNVIIDGRLVDLIHTNFLDYRLIVPRFVMRELQTIADASNELKRQRGRRGIESLNRLKKDALADVQVDDIDFPEIESVDAKLIHLAKQSGARILTNDYNLNKIAEVQNIKVLNLNNLATVLKPRYLQGEHLLVKIIKEGREENQGVGYLDDGTMVVVEGGRRRIGESVEVVIANTIQTSTGRMLFAEPLEK